MRFIGAMVRLFLAALVAIVGIVAFLPPLEGVSTGRVPAHVILLGAVVAFVSGAIVVRLVRAALPLMREPVENVEPPVCAECGSKQLLRVCPRWARFGRRRYPVLCRVCGTRADVSLAAWAMLPMPAPGDPHVTADDLYWADMNQPATLIELITILGLVLLFSVLCVARQFIPAAIALGLFFLFLFQRPWADRTRWHR